MVYGDSDNVRNTMPPSIAQLNPALPENLRPEKGHRGISRKHSEQQTSWPWLIVHFLECAPSRSFLQLLLCII